MNDLISRISLKQSIVASLILGGEKTLDQIIDEEPSIDAELQWIPCSERLPNEDEDVIVSIKGIGVHIGYLEYYCMGGEWCQRWWWYDECFDDDEFELVEAWMPFPKPYEAERKEE